MNTDTLTLRPKLLSFANLISTSFSSNNLESLVCLEGTKPDIPNLRCDGGSVDSLQPQVDPADHHADHAAGLVSRLVSAPSLPDCFCSVLCSSPTPTIITP
jgi:hypothetical protein